MILNPFALAWATWIGLVVSVVGLVLTYMEARRARIAAQTAMGEVAKVVAMARARTRLSSLTSAVSQADGIRAKIEDDTLGRHRELFTAFRRVAKEAFATLAIVDASLVDRLGEVDAALEGMARLIDEDIDAKLKRTQMRTKLNTVSDFLITQEARAKTEDLA